MKLESTLLPALTILVSSIAMASPIEDLASSDPAVRDKAAAELRVTFKSTPESKWTPKIAQIVKGQSEDEILATLRPICATREGVFAYGGGVGEGFHSTLSCHYRLDDAWALRCRFVDHKLADHKLVLAPRVIDVDPPKDFTGRWATYRINGQKCKEDDYIRGRMHGDSIIYYLDGSKLVAHYHDDTPDGEEAYYYPSGKIAQKSRHKMGKAVGTWTWYDESGNVTTTREYPNQ